MKLLYVFSLLVLLFHSSCSNKKTIGQLASPQFALGIKTWGMTGDTRFEVVYDNIPNHSPIYDTDHAFVIKTTYANDTVQQDTVRVALTGKQRDSLYYYTHQYVSSFQVNNTISVVDGIYRKESISDGASISVWLQFENKRLEASQYHLKGIGQASPEVSSMLTLINSRLQQGYKIY